VVRILPMCGVLLTYGIAVTMVVFGMLLTVYRCRLGS
jgi:hypothetical protein